MHHRVADERHLEDVRRARPPASRQSSAVSFARQPRTARVSSFSEPALSITYETRLIRSSPNRICGFISPAEASTSPVCEVAEVPGDRRRADVERDPVRRRRGTPARPPSDDRAVVHGDGDAPRGSVAQSTLKCSQNDGIDRETLQAPLALERVEQPREVARRRGELRAPRPRRSRGGRPGRPRSTARRPPCARPGGSTWLSGGTSIDDVRRDERRAAEPAAVARARGRARTPASVSRRPASGPRSCR